MIKTLRLPGFAAQENRRNGFTFEGLACAVLNWFVLGQLGLLALLPFLRGETASFLVIVAVGGLLSRRSTLPVLRATTVLTLALWLFVAFTPLVTVIVPPLKVAQTPEMADAVVVLQAGIQKDNDFAASTLQRTLHALELMQEGFVPRLVLTEDWPSQGSHEKAARTLMQNLHLHGQIFSVGPVHNTHDEALLASALLKQHGWGKILLVTSPTHSQRALLTFRKIGLQVISTPCQEASFDLENLNESGIDGRMRAFAEAVREIVGLRTYRARGWA